jgi:lipid-binding SYLF domain-containing protein
MSALWSDSSVVVAIVALIGCGGDSPRPVASAVASTELTFASPAPAVLGVRLIDATDVLMESVGDSGHQIPIEAAANAACVAVVPGAVRGGELAARARLPGVVSCRQGEAWSTPGFFVLTTGPTPRRIDSSAKDLVVLVTGEGAETQFTEHPHAAPGLRVTCYAHGDGGFLGVELGGVFLKPDAGAIRSYYGRDLQMTQLLVQPAEGGRSVAPYSAVVSTTFGHARRAFLGQL